MKSETDIRKMLSRLNDLHDSSFHGEIDDIYTDNDGEKFDSEESIDVLGKMQTAMYTLEWILEESLHYNFAVRPIKNESEAKHYKGKILVDANGNRLIPDNSIETFIDYMEGKW